MLDDLLERCESRLEGYEHRLPRWVWQLMDLLFMATMLTLFAMASVLAVFLGKRRSDKDANKPS